jgi:hypothetical protein
LEHISNELQIEPVTQLTDKFISELENALKYMPSLYDDTPGPSSIRGNGFNALLMNNFDTRPAWLPEEATQFGRDRGLPGTPEPDAVKLDKVFANGKPGEPQDRNSESDLQKLNRFMNQFGYIDEMESKSMGRWEKVQKRRQGIKKIQEQYGLKQTGRMDDALIDAISKPRCGHKGW